MTSLGYRVRNDHIAERLPSRETTSISLTVPEAAVAPKRRLLRCSMMGMPSGFLPLLVYAISAGLWPMLYLFLSFDFADDVVRGLTIAGAGGFALAILFANDCCVWFNMVLFFHVGIEAKILQHTFEYADADATPNEGMVLAWVGFGVVIAHLLPFFLLDHARLLTLCAAAGVPVNVALVLYIAPSANMLLLVVGSAATLLVTTLIVVAKDGYKPSLLTKLRTAIKEGGFLTC